MKTLLRLGFLVFVAIAITQPVHGHRFLKKLKEKVEERIEESVEKKEEEKVNEAIDEQINKVEESRTGTSEEDSDNSSVQREERMQNMLKGFGISGDPVPYEDNYRFDHLIQMHVESFDKNGKKEGDGEFITHFNMDAKSMAYEMISGNMSRQGEGTIIIDTENGALIML